MKKLLFLSLFLISFLNAKMVQGQSLSWTPEKPMQGFAMNIKFNPPAGTDTSFYGVAYTMTIDDKLMPQAYEVNFTKTDLDTYTSQFVIPAGVQSIQLVIKNNQGQVLGNNAYNLIVFDAAGNPVKGNLSAIALMNNYGFLWNGTRDPKLVFENLKKDLDKFPDLKSNTALMNTYNSNWLTQDKEAASTFFKNEISTVLARKKVKESELTYIRHLANLLQDKTLQDQIKVRVKKEYPKSAMASGYTAVDFRGETDLTKKEILFQTMRSDVQNAEKNKLALNTMATALAREYATKEDWTKMEKYLSFVTSNKANLLNSIAWPLTGESIDREGKLYELGKKWSGQSLVILKKDLEAGGNEKPIYQLPREYKNQLENQYHMFADTYALLAYKTGDVATAFAYQEAAVKHTNFGDGETNERYAYYLEQFKGAEEAEQFLESMVKDGKANTAMKAQHRRLFVKNYSADKAYDKYMMLLEAEAKTKMKEEMKKSMINEAAPVFNLLDLAGNSVSMESLRGKVVVLDFWATWCGPCKASFPSMQQAVNQFKEDDNVRFLFIDSWENVADKKKIVSEFIQKNAYSFQVLMDEKNEVIGQYKVNGIPTKFLIDPNGRIRFKSIGYDSNKDLLEEMKTMIAILKSETIKTNP